MFVVIWSHPSLKCQLCQAQSSYPNGYINPIRDDLKRIGYRPTNK